MVSLIVMCSRVIHRGLLDFRFSVCIYLSACFCFSILLFIVGKHIQMVSVLLSFKFLFGCVSRQYIIAYSGAECLQLSFYTKE